MRSAVANPTFWRKQRVFLTGHTGFKGSWLTLWLLKMGAEVFGYSLKPPTEPNLFGILGLASQVSGSEADIRDLSTLTQKLVDFQPTVVLHLAAQPLVRESYRTPIDTLTANVIGTANVLEAVRSLHKPCAVVVVTTDKCYENKEWDRPYKEDEPLGGYDPYSGSKACAEIVTSSYRRSFFPAEHFEQHRVGISSARAGNVFGGGDWAPERLIPDALLAFERGENLMIRRPDAVRPWQHVLEPLNGYLLLAENVHASASAARAFNFGPEEVDCRPVRDLVSLIAKEWGPSAKWTIDSSTKHPHEAGLLKLDSTLAKEHLHWAPTWNLEEGLRKTVVWHKALLEKSQMRDVTLKQIEMFEADCAAR